MFLLVMIVESKIKVLHDGSRSAILYCLNKTCTGSISPLLSSL